jgi:NAD(P)-dependent dehydrogenase (short-subunit alcohol dehydrogenase family)
MGRELTRQLAAGCRVAICDVSTDNMEQTRALCAEGGSPLRVSTHLADVSDEAQLVRFRDEVMREHETDCIHLLFNNAGIGGAGSLIVDERDAWEKTFNICWYGVYYGKALGSDPKR